MSPLGIITLAVFAAIIGAVPFGLVNLSVLDTSYRNGKSAAMHVAHGAAWIEVLYGFVSLMAGGLIAQFTRNNQLIRYVVLGIPALVGLVFFLKSSSNQTNNTDRSVGFFKGVFLNLISIQVFLYWLFAMTYIHTRWDIEFRALSVVYFILGIWLGKMLVLWVYAVYGQKLFMRFDFLAGNINRIIGATLIVSVVFQFLK